VPSGTIGKVISNHAKVNRAGVRPLNQADKKPPFVLAKG